MRAAALTGDACSPDHAAQAIELAVSQFGGITVYHSGDTLMHDGLIPALAPFRPDIAFLPINGNKPERRVAGKLDGREAAELAKAIHAGLAIPHHFDLFAFNTTSPEPFEIECQRLGQNYQVLRNGEGLDLCTTPVARASCPPPCLRRMNGLELGHCAGMV